MKTLFICTLMLLGGLLVPTVSYAAIDVTFQTTPLFGISNFLPGDIVTKTVTVTNTGSQSEDVYTELINVVDGGLASMLDVAVTSGGTLFSGSFNSFDAANEQFLSTLSPSATAVYTYTMSFKPQAGNEYQLKSLGFDICVGFSGGQFTCDKIENPNYSQGSYGGSGYSQGSYGGSGYSQGSYGGRSSNNPDGDVRGDSAGVPEVLGDQVSIMPNGAPNTGTGNTSALPLSIGVLLLLCTSFLIYFKNVSHAK